RSAPASPCYADEVLRDSPIGYWRLGEDAGSIAHDSSTAANHAVIDGGVALGAPGALARDPNTAMSFDGVEGLITALSSVDAGTNTVPLSSPSVVTGPPTIGWSAWSSSKTCDGTVDEVAIYGYVLPADRVMAHFLAAGSAPPEPLGSTCCISSDCLSGNCG